MIIISFEIRLSTRAKSAYTVLWGCTHARIDTVDAAERHLIGARGVICR